MPVFALSAFALSALHLVPAALHFLSAEHLSPLHFLSAEHLSPEHFLSAEHLASAEHFLSLSAQHFPLEHLPSQDAFFSPDAGAVPLRSAQADIRVTNMSACTTKRIFFNMSLPFIHLCFDRHVITRGNRGRYHRTGGKLNGFEALERLLTAPAVIERFAGRGAEFTAKFCLLSTTVRAECFTRKFHQFLVGF